ncbi:MAG: hypothetical protein QSU88_08105, partial [Candidatus Methanoperedens sp.]|nr:hypothetical protein [Candidatus Methanoperedens sp.]
GLDYNIHFGKHKWRGIEEGIPKMKEAANSIEDAEGNKPKITWFLRSDDQMKELYGDPAWMVRNFMCLWKKLESEGDEIGWHPHLWRWNERIEYWYPELDDTWWIKNCLEQGYNNFPEQFNLNSSRMCWNFHSNITMNKMNDLGLMVDISALPGMKSIKCARESAGSAYYDWGITDDRPYFPSKSDYRRESVTNEKSLDILEIPVTYFEISLLWYIKRILKKILQPNEGYPIGRRSEMKIITHGFFFKRGVERKFEESMDNNCTTFLVSYFHADELLEKEKFDPILNLKNNLRYLSEASKNYNVPFRFLTAREAALELIK